MYKQLPPGELAVRHASRVRASDGFAGYIDEFVVSKNGRITYLVIRKGHLWGMKDVLIPLSALKDIREDSLFLNFDRNQVEALPAFSIYKH
jgi:hypothetical protein